MFEKVAITSVFVSRQVKVISQVSILVLLVSLPGKERVFKKSFGFKKIAKLEVIFKFI